MRTQKGVWVLDSLPPSGYSLLCAMQLLPLPPSVRCRTSSCTFQQQRRSVSWQLRGCQCSPDALRMLI